MANSRQTRVQYHCSFCGKNQDQVQRLIAGPGAKVQSIDPDQLGSADIDYCLLRIEAV